MKGFRVYFLTQLKRLRQVFPFITAMTLLLTGCLILLALSMQTAEDASEKKKRVVIGLAGDTDSSYLSVGLLALRRLESTRYLFDFTLMSEQEAKKGLQDGRLTAYVVIPEGFEAAFDIGEKVEFLYATGNDTAAVSSVLMDELMDQIEETIGRTQQAINGIWNLMMRHPDGEDPDEVTDKMFLAYMDTILNWTAVYELTFCGWSDELSMKGYYFVGISVLFVLLWGITSSSLFVKKDYALPKLLKARGQSFAAQILAEYLVYLLLMLGNLFLMLLPLGTVLHVLKLEIPELGASPVWGVLLFLLKMLPAAALFAAMQFFLYELISDMVSGILLQFIVGVALGFLSGCIYPLSFFPQGIQRLAPLLPTGAAMQYGVGCMTGDVPFLQAAVMAAYLVLFLVSAAAVRTWRAGK